MITPASLSNLPTTDSITDMGILIIFLIVLQTLLIIGLQRSRMSNKRARHALKESQKALEQRIRERTDSLYLTNNLLIDEVARHEQTGRQLRETKLYLQSMINSMPSIIIGVTADAEVTHWNAAAENTFEIFSNDALGQNITTLLPRFPVTLQTIKTTIREGEPFSTQHVQQHDDEKNRYFEITIYPLISRTQEGAVIRIDDVTFKVTIENLMIQNEKMYSLGEVAAGIAHEINNPLSVILQNVQNIVRRTDIHFANNQARAQQQNINLTQVQDYLNSSEIPQMLDSIREAGERSATIVRNMLEFAHNSKRITGLIDVKHLVEQTIVLNRSSQLHVQDEHHLQISTNYQEPLPTIKASAPELQQVLLNLLRNAAQALHQHNTEQPVIHIKVYRENPHLVIEVQDNGPGMTDTVREHLFEPFFTTKDVGSGTGLGLSVSYFIITERHQGSIDVKTSPGKGSTFIIKLPLSDAE
ncbi:nitrogen regulation protein NR(II) [Cellvibrio sp. PSBB023]|uniref:two-component system sensor histidine kinase NtrB n=1 Tax=Cellvibrio sp. PSBB023 TaxID=1945512 RepID=UPI00098EF521|nr:ATP-binding protein [Cellvibrio sp. PSBB023]AQT59816.1 PAS domain-containing sensor histidine kinase [Cellvibrio sp. PSBB023]